MYRKSVKNGSAEVMWDPKESVIGFVLFLKHSSVSVVGVVQYADDTTISFTANTAEILKTEDLYTNQLSSIVFHGK